MGTTVSSGSRRKAASPEINVTPLVDVVLVLLIIFMVVTPQMESGEAVLAAAEEFGAQPTDDRTLLVLRV